MHTICISTPKAWQFEFHRVILVDTFTELNEAYMTISKACYTTRKPCRSEGVSNALEFEFIFFILVVYVHSIYCAEIT